ncbi:hypothetical protein KsCSTR_24980 [Candidatus Kuenenia stuttgartiensis]|uniref:Uncharacterized protein n=1 Tax=Kuenenia stuttgartiensis TaxID=174633 RepID=Q1Q431_KUEST|nr:MULTISPECIES: hypothetical protein [Kuenenia]MCZ7623288.1 hypothetical protein [Candidatus Kuenenia sp.]QII11877.1 hypothetical protein KsCSTR_24980 [Candidatus Kuenenia stuttgartiensis]CAJ74762.1 unknown protein [Candidatus Kuenenia stuttgartiensis]
MQNEVKALEREEKSANTRKDYEKAKEYMPILKSKKSMSMNRIRNVKQTAAAKRRLLQCRILLKSYPL